MFTQNDVSERMNLTCTDLAKKFAGIRTNQASPDLLDPIMVEAYGRLVPLREIASVSASEPMCLSVTPWDKSVMKNIEKSLRESSLGLNPLSDGQILRLRLPPLTTERRQELVKLTHKYAEEARVAIRTIRRTFLDQVKDLEKEKTISQDEAKKITTMVQAQTDAYIKKIDISATDKEKDLMSF